jgi:hypothetical protein
MKDTFSVFPLNSLCLTSESSNDLKKEILKELEFRIINYRSDIEDEREKLEEISRQRLETL